MQTRVCDRVWQQNDTRVWLTQTVWTIINGTIAAWREHRLYTRLTHNAKEHLISSAWYHCCLPHLTPLYPNPPPFPYHHIAAFTSPLELCTWVSHSLSHYLPRHRLIVECRLTVRKPSSATVYSIACDYDLFQLLALTPAFVSTISIRATWLTFAPAHWEPN